METQGKAGEEKGKGWREENSVFMNLWFLRLCGWWEDKNWSRPLRLLYSFYTGFIIFCHVILLVSPLINMLMEWGVIIVVIDIVNIILVGTTNTAKIIPFIFLRSKVERCLRRMARMESEGVVSDERRRLVAKAYRFTRMVCWTLIVSCMSSTTFWVAVVPYFVFKQSAEPTVTSTTVNETITDAATDELAVLHKPLPIQGWMPFDVTSSPGWEIAYILFALATVIHSWIACQTNGIFFAFMYFAATQFKALSAHLRALKARLRTLEKDMAKEIADGEEDGGQTLHSRSTVQRRQGLDEEMIRGLRDAVVHHQAIFSFIDAVQEILGPVMFTECLAISIMLCCEVYQATLVKIGSSKFLALVLFLVFEMLELLCFCWTGSQMILQSAAVGDAAFDSGWEDNTKDFKMSLQFMMLRTQKPSRISALGFSTLSLQLFTTLLRASYSFYAVLQSGKTH